MGYSQAQKQKLISASVSKRFPEKGLARQELRI
jgi:hypothetical protein